jgi:hypothetical protein
MILFALGLIVGASIGVIVFGLLTARMREYAEASQYLDGYRHGYRASVRGEMPAYRLDADVPEAFTRAMDS